MGPIGFELGLIDITPTPTQTHSHFQSLPLHPILSTYLCMYIFKIDLSLPILTAKHSTGRFCISFPFFLYICICINHTHPYTTYRCHFIYLSPHAFFFSLPSFSQIALSQVSMSFVTLNFIITFLFHL